MRPTLPSEIEGFLRERGTSTANEIALGVRARRDDVDDVLDADERFSRVAPPDGCSPRAVYFNLSYLVPQRRPASVSRADRMLEVLRDGRPHSRQEIFEATGSFFLTNNAASEIRKKHGIDVEHRVERGIHVYQLASTSGEPEAAA